MDEFRRWCEDKIYYGIEHSNTELMTLFTKVLFHYDDEHPDCNTCEYGLGGNLAIQCESCRGNPSLTNNYCKREK